jgi:adenine-specific DNA-methyltransferase
MKRVLDNVLRYTLTNTEQLGILVEKSMCDIVGTPFNTKRKYESLPQDITDDISSAIGPVIKRMKLKHVGNLNTTYDFVDESDQKTVSVKTIMSGNRICPQNIGQSSLKRLSEKMSSQFGVEFQSLQEFKKYFLDNKMKLMQYYLDNCFCCDTTIIYKFDRGCVYVITKQDKAKNTTTVKPITSTVKPITFLSDLVLSTSKNFDNWNESNTIYVDPKDTNGNTTNKGNIKKMSLGEIQLHKNRDCIKFRFNIDTLVTLIKNGEVNLSVDVYNLKTKYQFKVTRQSKIDMAKLCFPSFNYIGSKMKLLDFIKSSVLDYTGKKSYDEVSSFADICSGTGVVAYDVLRGGCKNIMTNDIQHYASVVSSVWCTKNIDVDKMKRIVHDLNEEVDKITEDSLSKQEHAQDFFIYNNYTTAGEAGRMYLTPINGYKTDHIRKRIENLKTDRQVNDNEYRLLLKLLLYAVSGVSNIASVYGAYLKNYKTVALKKLALNDSLISSLVNDKDITHQYYNIGILDLLNTQDLSEYEVVYMDPPYVANRSYHDNYHLLETISRYDNPQIKGKTGLREVVDTKSKFCSKRDAFSEFTSVLEKIKSKYMFISYSSESIVQKDEMIQLMQTTGWSDVKCYEKIYQRFKSNKNSDDKQPKQLVEYIFCGKRYF